MPLFSRRRSSMWVNELPTLYSIRIRGHLGSTTLAAFPTMTAHVQGNQTVLIGVLPDRSALYGLLAEIELLGLDLVELRQVPPERTHHGSEG